MLQGRSAFTAVSRAGYAPEPVRQDFSIRKNVVLQCFVISGGGALFAASTSVGSGVAATKPAAAAGASMPLESG